MNRLLEDRKEEIAQAMRGLCDAVGRLSLVRDELVEKLETLPPDAAQDRMILGMHRTCEQLTAAAASVPQDCWDIMLNGITVGDHELKQRVDTMLKNSFQWDCIQSRRLAGEV